MRLLERDTFLTSLAEYQADTRAGEGRLVLVAGEAGVGKTALLETFERDHGGLRWAWGACDGLFTPRPLGPLFDIARHLGGTLLDACERGVARDGLFDALLRELQTSKPPTVVVVEDLHWADEATLDMVRFVGRRLRDVPILLVVTYRDDALQPDHPVREVVGSLAAQRHSRRMSLPPLTASAVEELAVPASVAPGELYRLTGGNPFFITEILQSQDSALPASVRDAVLARVARLELPARQVLEAAAVAGSRVDPALLSVVADDAAAGLEACLASGVLAEDPAGLRFRHELARMAIEQAVPAHRRTTIHAALLAALRSHCSDDDARLAYHAEEAADAVAVLLHAPRAAQRAAGLGSHREAAAQYERALRFGAGVDAGARAELYDGLALELSMLDRWQEAADAWGAALPQWRAAGDRLREGSTLTLLSKAMWRLCRGRESAEATDAAITVLEPLGPTPELARATASQAGRWMLEGEGARATEAAHRAQELSAQLDLPDVMSDALNTEGCVAGGIGGDWLALMRRALDIALSAGLEAQASRAYSNLVGNGVSLRQFSDVEHYLVDGLAFADDRDMATFGTCLRGQGAIAMELTGRWQQALDVCDKLLRLTSVSPINRITPLFVAGTILVRRGEAAEGWRLLDEAAVSAGRTEEPQWLVGTGLRRVEAAWLEDDSRRAHDELLRFAPLARRCDPWAVGATALWFHRLGPGLDGAPFAEPIELPSPYALSLDGEWRAASEAWQSLGCCYESALALADSGQAEPMREALAELERLGATATAKLVRARMRRLGVKSVPTGPRSTTRSHQFGLTRREHEVLGLLCVGLANVDISRRLFISERTVDHHVSAVLTKMGVRSRGLAASEALRLGIVRPAAVGD